MVFHHKRVPTFCAMRQARALGRQSARSPGNVPHKLPASKAMIGGALGLLALLCLHAVRDVGACSMLNFCSGHGRCAPNGTDCICHEGWGSWSDFTTYRAPDCSARTCPAGRGWSDLPVSSTDAHQLVECSNAGHCNRKTGVCECLPGFTGKACSRTKCRNDCSGHGKCKSMTRMAMDSTALPVGPNWGYGYYPSGAAWDGESTFGCVCDSTWPVGYGAGEYFVAEWFGPDCSKRHCPSGWDRKYQNANSTDCFNVTTGSANMTTGMPGSLCFQECSKQGVCDYRTGVCNCYSGRWGGSCEFFDGYVPPVENITVEVFVDDTVVYYENLARSRREAAQRLKELTGWHD